MALVRFSRPVDIQHGRQVVILDDGSLFAVGNVDDLSQSEIDRLSSTCVLDPYTAPVSSSDQVALLVADAPSSFDTLKEIADRLAVDDSALDSLLSSVAARALQTDLDLVESRTPTTGEKAALAGSDGTPSNTMRYLNRAARLLVTDQRFGASTAAGAEQNAGAIQAALDFAAGDPVFIPPGTFACGALKVADDYWLEGAGRGRTVLSAEAEIGDHLITCKPPVSGTVFNRAIGTIRRVHISDMKLVGNSAQQHEGLPIDSVGVVAPNSQHGISNMGGEHWTIERVWVEDFDGDGIYLGRPGLASAPGMCLHNSITDCVATNNIRNGMMLSDGRYNQWTRCLLTGNQRGIVPTEPKYSLGAYLSAELDLEPNGTHGQEFAQYNTFRDCRFIGGHGAAMQWKDIQFNEFSGCWFIDNATDGIVALSQYNAGNHLHDCWFIATSAAAVANGHLRIAQGSDNVIEDNHFIGATGGGNAQYAIMLDSVGGARPQRNVIRRNIVDIAPGGETGRGATVFVDATADGTEVDDNTYTSGIVDLRDTSRRRRGLDVQRRGHMTPRLDLDRADLMLVSPGASTYRGYLQRFVLDQDMPLIAMDHIVTTASSANDQLDCAIYVVDSAGTLTLLVRSGALNSHLNSTGLKTSAIAASLRRGVVYYRGWLGAFGGGGATAAIVRARSYGSQLEAALSAASGTLTGTPAQVGVGEVESLFRDFSAVAWTTTIVSGLVVSDTQPLVNLRSAA